MQRILSGTFGIAAILTIAVFAVVLSASQGVASTDPRKYAAIIIDEDTGQVLHSERADERRYPASLTKIMTLYMVFDALERGEISLKTPLKVSRTAARVEPSKLYLKPGETITVENAILALVTKSANDVAVVVAEALGGSEQKFAQMMTRKAREIGLTRTQFRNASGLPNRNQYTTARDMAQLGQRVRRDFPKYYHYFSRKTFTYKGRRFGNHNKLLRHYSGTDGIKTGYIRASGFNLVASVRRDGRRVVGVVMGGHSGRWRNKRMMILMNNAYTHIAQNDAVRPTQFAHAELPMPEPVDGLPRPNPFLVAQGDASDPSEEELVGWVNHSWQIQVGAFKYQTAARRHAQTAHESLADFEATTVVDINQHRSRGLWRSRILGFESESHARSACRVMRGANFDCLVVAPKKTG